MVGGGWEDAYDSLTVMETGFSEKRSILDVKFHMPI